MQFLFQAPNVLLITSSLRSLFHDHEIRDLKNTRVVFKFLLTVSSNVEILFFHCYTVKIICLRQSVKRMFSLPVKDQLQDKSEM